ncbi:unnamed protein product [Closterium sp. Naga37s-1]|nr:unnamed protein product [Closterium sp. Naga37s-1]
MLSLSSIRISPFPLSPFFPNNAVRLSEQHQLKSFTSSRGALPSFLSHTILPRFFPFHPPSPPPRLPPPLSPMRAQPTRVCSATAAPMRNLRYDLHCDVLYDLHCNLRYDLHCDVLYDLHCDVLYDLHCDVLYDLQCDVLYDLHCTPLPFAPPPPPPSDVLYDLHCAMQSELWREQAL